jgi:hypothetical protein
MSKSGRIGFSVQGRPPLHFEIEIDWIVSPVLNVKQANQVSLTGSAPAPNPENISQQIYAGYRGFCGQFGEAVGVRAQPAMPFSE